MAVNEFSNEALRVKKLTKNIDHGFHKYRVDHHGSKRTFKRGLAGKKTDKKY